MGFNTSGKLTLYMTVILKKDSEEERGRSLTLVSAAFCGCVCSKLLRRHFVFKVDLGTCSPSQSICGYINTEELRLQASWPLLLPAYTQSVCVVWAICQDFTPSYVVVKLMSEMLIFFFCFCILNFTEFYVDVQSVLMVNVVNQFKHLAINTTYWTNWLLFIELLYIGSQQPISL